MNTNILDCARNRPSELAATTEPMSGPVADAFREWFTEQLRQGLDPRRVGDQVLAAIRDDRFYILTHPEWNPTVEHRVRAIIAGDNPSVLPPPGFETLMQKLAAIAGGQGST